MSSSLSDNTYLLLNRFSNTDDESKAVEVSMLEDKAIDEHTEYKTLELKGEFELGLSRFVKQLANRWSTRKHTSTEQTVFDWAVFFSKRTDFNKTDRNEEELLRCFDEASYVIQRTLITIRLIRTDCCRRLRFSDVTRNQTMTTRFIDLALTFNSESRIRALLKHAPIQQLIAMEKDFKDLVNWFKNLAYPLSSDIDVSVHLFHSVNPSVIDSTDVVSPRDVKADVVLLISQACCEPMIRCLNPDDTNQSISDALIGSKSQAYLQALSCLNEIGRRVSSTPSRHSTTKDTEALMIESFELRVLLADFVSMFNAGERVKSNTAALKALSCVVAKKQKELSEWFAMRLTRSSSCSM